MAGEIPLILTLDNHGVPHRWVNWQQACFYYAKNLVAWTLGEQEFVFHGGISRATGRRSSITARSIIAIKGKAMAMKGFNQVPPLNNRELFRRDRHICAYCGGGFSFLRLTRDHIRPDMVPRPPQKAESPSAIRADMAVAAKQLAVVERRHLIEALHRHRLALDRDDRARRDARAPARRTGDAAVENELLFAEGPGHQVLRVVEARLLPVDPAVRHPVIIQGQNQRNFARHTKFSISSCSKLLAEQSSAADCAGKIQATPYLSLSGRRARAQRRRIRRFRPPWTPIRPVPPCRPPPSVASSRAWRAPR